MDLSLPGTEQAGVNFMLLYPLSTSLSLILCSIVHFPGCMNNPAKGCLKADYPARNCRYPVAVSAFINSSAAQSPAEL
jgi:hypothetical protein